MYLDAKNAVAKTERRCTEDILIVGLTGGIREWDIIIICTGIFRKS